MSVPTGGVVEDDAAYLYSGGVPSTVNPAATILTTSESNMQYQTITLTDDQVSLISETAKTVKKESNDEILDPSSRAKLKETLLNDTLPGKLLQLGLPPGRVEIACITTKASVFEVKNSDAVLAIELVDSEARRHVRIYSPTSIDYQWPRNTASILPRGWMLKSDVEEFYLLLLQFKTKR